MPLHLNGDRTDHIGDLTDFNADMYSTKSSVGLHASLFCHGSCSHQHVKQRLTSPYHFNCHCHCRCCHRMLPSIERMLPSTAFPSRPPPSSHRHRLTDTSILYRRHSHRHIARSTPSLPSVDNFAANLATGTTNANTFAPLSSRQVPPSIS